MALCYAPVKLILKKKKKMTAAELSKFVNQQHLKGMSDEAIAGSLGLTPEAMYRKMGEGDDEGVKETKE